MTHYVMTEKQAQYSMSGATVDPSVLSAIEMADKMASCGGSPMTVVRTKNHGICVYHDYQTRVANNEIIETIYSTENGFTFRSVA